MEELPLPLEVRPKFGVIIRHYTRKNEYLLLQKIFTEIPENDPVLNELGSDGLNALHIAVKYSYSNCAKVLVIKGANTNAKTKDGLTPILLISQVNVSCYHMFSYLIKNGADIYAKNKNGWTVAHFAVYFGRHEDLFLLIKNGYDINNDGSFLKLALENGCYFCVALLIDNGINIDTPSISSMNFLNGRIKDILMKPITLETPLQILSDIDIKDDFLSMYAMSYFFERRFLIYVSNPLYLYDPKYKELNLLQKLMEISSSPMCLPQGNICGRRTSNIKSYRYYYHQIPAKTWFDSTLKSRKKISRDYIWERRKNFVFFLKSYGGPLTNFTKNLKDCIIEESSDSYDSDGSVYKNESSDSDSDSDESSSKYVYISEYEYLKKNERERTFFLKDKSNDEFLRKNMTAVLCSANPMYRKTIASYL